MSISIRFHKQDVRIKKRSIEETCAFFLKELKAEKYSLSLLFTDDQKICELNHQYRDKKRPTNVLSFPLNDSLNSDIESLQIFELGDIVISIDSAAREAKELGHRFLDRVHWLIIHGLLHLLGYDHERSEEEAELMYEKEKILLDKLRNRRSASMVKLAINVDHVATIREARGTIEPDPVTAAAICELAGAQGIVVHLREDRRHIQDRDVHLLRKTVQTKLNLEMGANKEIIEIALDVMPDLVTLVPEKREELTTEGGLDVLGQKKKLTKVINKFRKAGIPVSLFIDPDLDQVQASVDVGATFVEIHTGRYSDALTTEEQNLEFDLIYKAAHKGHELGLIVNGGHGLDYKNTERIAAIDVIDELSIGHSIISRSVFSGLDQAVRDMMAIIANAR